jgi:putative endonuclease
MKNQKRSNHRRGILAEYVALMLLTLKGYRLVAMRYKTPVGEVDLIVRRAATLVFVEVKARANADDAAISIHAKNQSRVVRASQMFLVNHPAYTNHQVRFDAVLIAWYRIPRHLTNAFGDA